MFDACWSSDLRRARKTAEIILAGQPNPVIVQFDARGREKVTHRLLSKLESGTRLYLPLALLQYLGALQGTHYWTQHSATDIASCEPREIFMARLLEFLDEEVLATAAKEMAAAGKDMNVLLVGHSTPIKIYMQLFVGLHDQGPLRTLPGTVSDLISPSPGRRTTRASSGQPRSWTEQKRTSSKSPIAPSPSCIFSRALARTQSHRRQPLVRSSGRALARSLARQH